MDEEIKENNNWIYVGIFLNEKSKKLLKKLYPTPKGWKEYYDHMTVVFNDHTDIAEAVKSINKSDFGATCKLKIIGTGISNKSFAAQVELPKGIVCANKIAHITLATSPIGNAVDSNYITNWSRTYDNIYVTGEMRVFESTEQKGLLELPHLYDEANVY